MLLNFDQIIGHKKQLNYLKKVIEQDSASHAYCFSGPAQIGKYTIARHFVAQILKSDEARLKIHPNVDIVNTEKISIEQIRSLCERLTLSTLGGGIKVAIINNAHLMAGNAQSALLKTLEEPRGRTVIILITEKPEDLLLTILSRSAHIKFHLVASADIKSEFAELCAGQPGLAVKLANDEYKAEFLELKNQADNFLSMSIAERFALIESILKQKETKNAKIKELISFWYILIRQRMLKSIADQTNSKKYATALTALQETEIALASNSNQSLALQHFALSF